MKKYFTLIVVFFLLFSHLIISCSKDTESGRINSIKFETETITLTVGESTILNIKHFPENLSSPNYDWSSSDEKVVKIDAGKITAISTGEAIISAKTNSLQAKLKILVQPLRPTSIEILLDNQKMLIDEEQLIKFKIKPENSTNIENMKVEWSSSNEKVFIISEGKIITKGLGNADLTGKIKDTDITGKINISVLPILPQSLEILVDKLNMNSGEKQILKYKIEPINSTNIQNFEIEWSSSNEKVLKIIGNEVFAMGIGEATISGKIKGTNITDGINITVSGIPVKEITISEKPPRLRIGQSFKLSPSIYPENATNKNIIYTSSNPSLASINDVGLITGKNNGETQIKIQSADGNVTSYLNVIVQQPVERISIIPNNITMEIQEEKKFEAIVYPENAYNKEFFWKIPDLISPVIFNNGKVSAVKKGSFTLQAISKADNQIIGYVHVPIKDLEELTEIKQISSDLTKDAKGYYSGTVTVEIINRSKLFNMTFSVNIFGHSYNNMRTDETKGISVEKGKSNQVTFNFKDTYSPKITTSCTHHYYGYRTDFSKAILVK